MKKPRFKIQNLVSRIQSSHAFSMIEISMALAIIGFAMISVLGLLSIGLQATQDASDDHKASLLIQAIIADRQSTSYDQPTPVINPAGTTFGIPALNSAYPSGGYALFFKKSGGAPQNPTSSAGSIVPGYYYEIDVQPNSSPSI